MIRRPLTSFGLKRDDIEQMEACLKLKFGTQNSLDPKSKDLDDSDAWENAEVTEEQCPRCAHTRAYFMQLQTRSADEPATILYRCANADCAHSWKS